MALSVSISAKISPSVTVSPTFLSQLATVPSSMVSLKRGMVIISTPTGNSAAAELASTASAGAVSLVASATAPPPSKAEMSSPF